MSNDGTSLKDMIVSSGDQEGRVGGAFLAGTNIYDQNSRETRTVCRFGQCLSVSDGPADPRLRKT